MDVGRILAITFTEKAAAELKARVRARFEALGDAERARATEGAWISTIHSFCARLLRAHALAAGLDPRFAVLDEREARRLAAESFAIALDDLVAAHGDLALGLIAAYRPADLRDAIVALHGELRSRGQEHPQLPPARPAPLGPAPERARARTRAGGRRAGGGERRQDGRARPRAPGRLRGAARATARPIRRCRRRSTRSRSGATASRSTAAAARPTASALAAFADACADVAALPTHALLDAVLQGFAHRYAEAKRAASALDFEDLELGANRLLREHEPLRARYAERFRHVMVDEFQDTNPLQLELLERIAGDELFAVGDELQSIYGFRHADVRLFRARRARLAERGASATLAANFRSHPDLLRAVNLAFAPRFGASFTPLVAGREEPADAAPPPGPRVELLVADRSAAWEDAGLVAPGAVPPAPLWRLAEARLLAARVGELIAAGRPAGEIVLLLRATGDLGVFERALVERGVSTYVIGGRGYWAQQQVRDLVAYLSVLANPRDGVALYALLASPLIGLSSDGLVQVAAAARAAERDPWWTLIDDGALLERLDAEDRARVEWLRGWLPHERRDAPRHGLEDLLDRALARTGYDEVLLRMEGGARRMANVRKLMRLAREHEARQGRDLRGFADLVGSLVGGADASGDERESEAPVEGEALDAVRVMTIHRAKGLEFPVVCVADLGRESPAAGREPVRVGDDGRVGIRLRRLGGARPRDAFAFRALVEQQRRRDAEEEARLFYVAVTRAREQLILSGAAPCDPWPESKPGAPPMSWLGPAFVPDIGLRCASDAEPRSVASHDDVSVAVTIARPALVAELAPLASAPSAPSASALLRAGPVASGRTHTAPSGGARASSAPPARSASPVSALSYTALAQHAQCGYRFYLERVLGLPPTDEARFGSVQRAPAELDPLVRGRIVHSLLEAVDFGHPTPPGFADVTAEAQRAGARLSDAIAQEIADLIANLLATDLPRRLAALKDLRREQPFALALDAIPLVGVFDLIGRERDRVLVVDWKSDRLDPDADPRAIADADYGLQRTAYALAALRDGAGEVEVLHVFLEHPDEPATATYRPQDLPQLTADLQARADAVLDRDFPVAPDPQPRICDGCPGRGSLCSWPLEATLDVPEGRLF